MNNEYYYRLVSLPLFQGLTREDALEMAGRARFDFRRPADGERIVAEQQECRELIFVIQGKLRSVEQAADCTFSLEEYVDAPLVLQPERLFGRRPRYTKDFYAEGDDVQLLVVEKADVRDILFTYTAFHLNYLNYVCSNQQVLLQRMWIPSSSDLQNRFVTFLQRRCSTMSGSKRLLVGMNELAEHLLTTRLNVSRMLHELEEKQLVELRRGVVDIPAAERLFNSL